MKSVEAPNRCNKPDMYRLVSTYGDSLFRMCFLYLRDLQLAEDSVQDTYLKVYKSWSTFKGESTEKTWVMRIAINVCKNRLRTLRFKDLDIESALTKALVQDEMHLPDDKVLIEIMRLTPKYKEVLLLYYYQELKVREIAQVLHIPESTVSVRLMRAKEQLKPRLKEWYFNE